MSSPARSTRRSPATVRLFRRYYGAGPLHLVGLLASFAFAGYVIARVATVGHRWQIGLWFLGALIFNDFVVFPLYSVVDRVWREILGLKPVRRIVPRVPVINHLRVPAFMSGIFLLISFPLVFRLAPSTYRRATDLTPDPYLARWLVITAVLFALSALIYGLRVTQSFRRSHGSAKPSEAAGADPGVKGTGQRIYTTREGEPILPR